MFTSEKSKFVILVSALVCVCCFVCANVRLPCICQKRKFFSLLLARRLHGMGEKYAHTGEKCFLKSDWKLVEIEREINRIETQTKINKAEIAQRQNAKKQRTKPVKLTYTHAVLNENVWKAEKIEKELLWSETINKWTNFKDYRFYFDSAKLHSTNTHTYVLVLFLRRLVSSASFPPAPATQRNHLRSKNTWHSSTYIWMCEKTCEKI